jgi:hypothetical protein
VLTLYTVGSNVLSGLIVPVAFFPGPLRAVAYATPFPSMLQAPVDIAVELGRLAVAGGSLAIGLSQVDIDWTPGRVALFVLAPLSGAVLFGSFFVLSGASAFWLIDGSEVGNALSYGSGCRRRSPRTCRWWRCSAGPSRSGCRPGCPG